MPAITPNSVSTMFSRYTYDATSPSKKPSTFSVASSLSFGDVDVVQVVQHHKRQQARRYDQHHDDDVEGTKHVVNLINQVGCERDCRYTVVRHDFSPSAVS